MVRGRSFTVGAVVLAALALPAVALAANPSESQGQAAQAEGLLGSQSSGTLPFTGMNLALIVVGGLVLLASGLLLRRRGSHSES